ncbi:MAG: hypothetical protein AAFP19_10855 [Bacteroidota bacterium]
MIDLEEAQEIALLYFNKGVKPESELVIIPAETLVFEEGFIFSVNTKKYIIEGDIGYRISGLPCILVDKRNGKVFNPYINEYIYPNDLIARYRKQIKSHQ